MSSTANDGRERFVEIMCQHRRSVGHGFPAFCDWRSDSSAHGRWLMSAASGTIAMTAPSAPRIGRSKNHSYAHPEGSWSEISSCIVSPLAARGDAGPDPRGHSRGCGKPGRVPEFLAYHDSQRLADNFQ